MESHLSEEPTTWGRRPADAESRVKLPAPARETRHVARPAGEGWRWGLPVVSAVFGMIAVRWAGRVSWGPGTLSLMLMIVPVAAAAVTGRRRVASLTVAIAALACLIEGGLGWGHERAHDWPFALFAIGLLLALSGAVLGLSEGRVNPESPAEPRHDPDSIWTDVPPPLRAVPLSQEDLTPLLLALQEVVRRIVGDLDRNTLPETIVDTARQLLGADDCRMGLWKQSDGSLRWVAGRSESEPEREAADTASPLIRWVLSHRKAALRGDPTNVNELTRLFVLSSRWDAIVPLIAGGELLGLLALRGVDNSPRQQRMLAIVTNVSALAWKNATLFARIEEMGRHDGLTGLLTHASFFEAARTSAAGTSPWTVLIADADRFKDVNDRYGHPVGDAVLREIARVWRALLPKEAIVGRYGGEEFIALLPHCDSVQASEYAELLRQQIETGTLSGVPIDLRMTLSLGVAEHRPGLAGAEGLAEAVSRADQALYRAKHSGRNRVSVAP
jgi:diguanylate cyclase (GGDEF)-like protein